MHRGYESENCHFNHRALSLINGVIMSVKWWLTCFRRTVHLYISGALWKAIKPSQTSPLKGTAVGWCSLQQWHLWDSKQYPICLLRRSRHAKTHDQMDLNNQHQRTSNKPLDSMGNGLDKITCPQQGPHPILRLPYSTEKVIIDTREEDRVAGFNKNLFCLLHYKAALKLSPLSFAKFFVIQSWNACN